MPTVPLAQIATAPDQVPNPIGALPNTAIQSLYLRGSDDPLHQLTQDQEKNFLITLFYWRSPVLTLTFLFCINAIAILVTLFDFNLITLLCYIVLVQIIMSLVYIRLTKLYLNFQGATPTIHEITQYDGPYYSREEIVATVNFICTHLFGFIDQLILVYRGINTTKSIVSIMVLFTVAQLARLIPLSLLSAWSITGLAVVLLFRTHPTFKRLIYNVDIWFSSPTTGPINGPQPQLYQQGGRPPYQPPQQQQPQQQYVMGIDQNGPLSDSGTAVPPSAALANRNKSHAPNGIAPK